MIRERVLTILTLLALVALSGVAHADPKITGKSYRTTAPDWYRARTMQGAPPPAQIAPEWTGRQIGCRYLYSGGPKNPVTC